MGLARSGAADEYRIALMGKEVAAGGPPRGSALNRVAVNRCRLGKSDRKTGRPYRLRGSSVAPHNIALEKSSTAQIRSQ
jgi:hypothetical protein